VECQPTPVQTFQLIIVAQRCFPQAHEEAITVPLLKAAVGGGAFANTSGIQGFPLAAASQHEEDEEDTV
jgi:hypothetical protein